MKRLSLEELKTQKAGQIKESLEAIKGGNTSDCHPMTLRDIFVRFGLWLHNQSL